MSTVAQDPPEVFQSCQRRLGQSGRPGVSALLFDPNGERRAHIGFNEDDRFPMASVVKVPIGMLIACEIANRTLSVDEKIRIHSRTASPGLIGNPLDRFYFLPFGIVRTHTVEQPMAFMFHHSDNTATDAILRRLGGTSALTNFLRDLQIEGISIKRTMHELLTYLNMQGVSTFLTLAQQGIVGPILSDIDISYLADSIILLRYFEAMGDVRKAISVFKKRSGPHETTIRELKLTPGGILVGEPLNSFQGVLTGTPVYGGKPSPLLSVPDGQNS